ncbi:MAG: sugar transporter ATP-binding protein, partial [Cellulosimicrobium sp.]|nr:sugar transporter ATP-binding protein [Cellulosimicrobium sp.]
MVTADPPQPLLQMQGIVKVFPGARALDGVDLEILPGEVHCLLGQNGAGKSTLIKVLAGAHQPTEGQILLDGEPITISDPVAALRHGVATMYQELDVVDGLTVAENVYLGHELSTLGFSQRREAVRKTRELLKRLGHSEISPTKEVEHLSAAGKQIVSMARALSHDARVIIMDEPSAVLDSEEVGNLFRVVKELTKSGVAVVYISHRLEEIREIGDRITVLKDGRTVAQNLPVSETPTAKLITLMTGRSVEYVFPETDGPTEDAPVVLDVAGLALRGVFEDVSLQVRAGEIVGLAGLVGAGRSEIIETIYGARRATAGTVTVDSKKLRVGSVASAVDAGIGLAPEERKSQGLLLDEPVYRNVTLSTFARFARGGLLDEGAERKAAKEQADSLELRPAGVDRAIRTLSGGNQQKAMLARWLVHG